MDNWPDASSENERNVGGKETIVPDIRVMPSVCDCQSNKQVKIIDRPDSQYAPHIEFWNAYRPASLLFVQQQIGDQKTADDKKQSHTVGNNRKVETLYTPIAKVLLEHMPPHDRERRNGTQSVKPWKMYAVGHWNGLLQTDLQADIHSRHNKLNFISSYFILSSLI